MPRPVLLHSQASNDHELPDHSDHHWGLRNNFCGVYSRRRQKNPDDRSLPSVYWLTKSPWWFQNNLSNKIMTGPCSKPFLVASAIWVKSRQLLGLGVFCSTTHPIPTTNTHFFVLSIVLHVHSQDQSSHLTISPQVAPLPWFISLCLPMEVLILLVTHFGFFDETTRVTHILSMCSTTMLCFQLRRRTFLRI